MSDELKKVGKDDPWPKSQRPLPQPEPSGTRHTDPCAICGVDGDHHGIGEHFNVDHLYQRALSSYEQVLLADAQYWRKEAETLYVENERLRAALGEISSIPGPGIVALRLIAASALAQHQEER